MVHGFRTNIEALQFEWAVKHAAPRGKGGMTMRIKKLYDTLRKERWTSRAPPAADVPLRVEWYQPYTLTHGDIPIFVEEIDYTTGQSDKIVLE